MKGKMKLGCSKPALVVGLYVAILHALWAGLVALGVGQAVLNWILPLHFIDSMYTVITFNLLNAALLIVFAFIGGYVATWLFMLLWKAIKVK